MPGPGENYYGEFFTSNPNTGAIQTADSLPTATANRNGVDDGTFSLTVALLSTGRYSVSGTVPSGYVVADTVNITVTAAVASITGGARVDSFQVVRAQTAGLSTFPFYMATSVDGRSPAINRIVTATRSNDNAVFVTCDNSATITETGNGWYAINLTAHDLTFTNSVALQFSAPGCDSTLYTLLND